jgi:hypothetical protein
VSEQEAWERENAWNRLYWLELDDAAREKVRHAVRAGARVDEPTYEMATYLMAKRHRRAARYVAIWLTFVAVTAAAGMLWTVGPDAWRSILFGLAWKLVFVSAAFWYAVRADRAVTANAPRDASTGPEKDSR